MSFNISLFTKKTPRRKKKAEYIMDWFINKKFQGPVSHVTRSIKSELIVADNRAAATYRGLELESGKK